MHWSLVTGSSLEAGKLELKRIEDDPDGRLAAWWDDFELVTVQTFSAVA